MFKQKVNQKMYKVYGLFSTVRMSLATAKGDPMNCQFALFLLNAKADN